MAKWTCLQPKRGQHLSDEPPPLPKKESSRRLSVMEHLSGVKVAKSRRSEVWDRDGDGKLDRTEQSEQSHHAAVIAHTSSAPRFPMRHHLG